MGSVVVVRVRGLRHDIYAYSTNVKVSSAVRRSRTSRYCEYFRNNSWICHVRTIVLGRQVAFGVQNLTTPWGRPSFVAYGSLAGGGLNSSADHRWVCSKSGNARCCGRPRKAVPMAPPAEISSVAISISQKFGLTHRWDASDSSSATRHTAARVLPDVQCVLCMTPHDTLLQFPASR